MTEHNHGPGANPSEGDCVDYLEQIVDLLDNELDEADCSAVRMHLDACNPCLERYDLQRTVKAIVARSCSEPAPDEVRRRVLMRIREVQVRIGDV
jgi:mycothiol system anti-sigma-R factor